MSEFLNAYSEMNVNAISYGLHPQCFYFYSMFSPNSKKIKKWFCMNFAFLNITLLCNHIILIFLEGSFVLLVFEELELFNEMIQQVQNGY